MAGANLTSSASGSGCVAANGYDDDDEEEEEAEDEDEEEAAVVCQNIWASVGESLSLIMTAWQRTATTRGSRKRRQHFEYAVGADQLDVMMNNHLIL